MIKEILLLTVMSASVCYVNCQNPLMMMSLMSGGRGGAAGGLGGGLMKVMNNPFLLCRETESMGRVPCKIQPKLCDFMSYKEYKVPGLLKCSPMGIGCCLKDFKAFQLAKLFN